MPRCVPRLLRATAPCGCLPSPHAPQIVAALQGSVQLHYVPKQCRLNEMVDALLVIAVTHAKEDGRGRYSVVS